MKPEAAKAQFSYIVLRDDLNDFLKLLETKGKKGASKGAVVLLDEGDALTLNEKLLHVFRNAFQEIKGVCLVVAGSTKLSSQVGVVFSLVPRFFRKIELGPYPNNEIVDQAIQEPLRINRKDLLLNHQVRLEVQHLGFDRRVKEVTARIPMHINMLCNFAYELGAKELRQDRSTNYILRMNFSKELMEEAINQLRGTKNYSDFIASLDNNEANFVRILSRPPIKLSIKEATILVALDELRDLLQTLPVNDLCKQISNCDLIVSTMSDIVTGLVAKASKYDIDLLGADVLKKKFDIQDHWIRAYFRYSVQSFHFNIEITEIPFIGVHFFGDSVSSIIHSIFFARLSKFMDANDRSRAHEGPTSADELMPWRDRKLLMATYKRTDDLMYHHIAFNLRAAANTVSTKKEIEQILERLLDLGLISDFRTREPSTIIYH